MTKSPHESIESGHLLIAGAQLVDPNFSRSVVLICEHIDQGSFGLILNHKTDLNVQDIIDDISWNAPIFKGGPVEENSLHFIYRDPKHSLGGKEVAPGIFWGGDFETLVERVNEGVLPAEDCRFFVGYSGWSPGQLREEVITDSWHLTPATEELVFVDDAANHWRMVLKTMGPEYRLLSTFPDDPRLN